MTEAHQCSQPVVGRLEAPVSRWNRLLWGVVFTTGPADRDPMLIGGLWAADLGGEPYAGEPTRALLFCTRQQARAWCADTMSKWRDGRQRDDIVARWTVRPVRVRETVQIEAPNYSPDKPLSCGAHVWAETQGEVTIVT